MSKFNFPADLEELDRRLYARIDLGEGYSLSARAHCGSYATVGGYRIMDLGMGYRPPKEIVDTWELALLGPNGVMNPRHVPGLTDALPWVDDRWEDFGEMVVAGYIGVEHVQEFIDWMRSNHE